MKRILLTVMVWVVSLIVSVAAPVSEQAAMLAAQKFLRQQMPAMSRGESRGLTRAFTGLADGEEVGIYVFNATNGYVVVSADDNLPEILAYGNGEPFDAAKAPADMKAMLEAYYGINWNHTMLYALPNLVKESVLQAVSQRQWRRSCTITSILLTMSGTK